MQRKVPLSTTLNQPPIKTLTRTYDLEGPFATVRAFLHIYPSLKLRTVAALSGAVVNGTHRPAQKVP